MNPRQPIRRRFTFSLPGTSCISLPYGKVVFPYFKKRVAAARRAAPFALLGGRLDTAKTTRGW
jgi:hypothetical protein